MVWLREIGLPAWALVDCLALPQQPLAEVMGLEDLCPWSERVSATGTFSFGGRAQPPQ